MTGRGLVKKNTAYSVKKKQEKKIKVNKQRHLSLKYTSKNLTRN